MAEKDRARGIQLTLINGLQPSKSKIIAYFNLPFLVIQFRSDPGV